MYAVGMTEVTLPGGCTTGAVLIDGVVHKPASPWTSSVHALLRHLQETGFERRVHDASLSFVPPAEQRWFIGVLGPGQYAVSLPGDLSTGDVQVTTWFAAEGSPDESTRGRCKIIRWSRSAMTGCRSR